MNNECFYCNDPLEEKTVHFISFFHEYQDREEALCSGCYSEWLEGIKE